MRIKVTALTNNPARLIVKEAAFDGVECEIVEAAAMVELAWKAEGHAVRVDHSDFDTYPVTRPDGRIVHCSVPRS